MGWDGGQIETFQDISNTETKFFLQFCLFIFVFAQQMLPSSLLSKTNVFGVWDELWLSNTANLNSQFHHNDIAFQTTAKDGSGLFLGNNSSLFMP